MALTRVRQSSALLSTALLAALALTGCGSSGKEAPSVGSAPSTSTREGGVTPSAPPRQAPADPCKLISPQEARELGGTSGRSDSCSTNRAPGSR